MDKIEILRQAEEIIGQKLQCNVPFEHLQFFDEGNIYFCSFMEDSYLGNIFEQSFDEIWNGEKAEKLRASISDGSFKYCNLAYCLSLSNLKINDKYNFGITEPFIKTETPKFIHFNVDANCNAKCITCRDKNEVKPEAVKKYKEFFAKELKGMLKSTERVYINGAGELFTK